VRGGIDSSWGWTGCSQRGVGATAGFQVSSKSTRDELELKRALTRVHDQLAPEQGTSSRLAGERDKRTNAVANTNKQQELDCGEMQSFRGNALHPTGRGAHVTCTAGESSADGRALG
jgi:hypothetical protein